jgi:O-antigen/teichoic acid export membrane protein
MSLAFMAMPVAHMRRTFRKSATFIVNTGALAAGTMAAAALGFVYWWLAARMFPPEAIGRASALLSVMGLVGLLGEAGLGTLLIGETVRHRDRAPGLTAATAVFGLLLALGSASLFVAGEAYLVKSRGPIDGWIEASIFIVGCGVTVLTMVGDQAFVGSLNSVGRMIQQVLFSTFKLVLIAVAVIAGLASDAAILLTWVAGMAASWVAFDLVTGGGARRLVGRPDFGLLRSLRRRVMDHYALDVSLQAPGTIMPYMVLVLLSPATNAAFASLWMMVSMASVIPAVAATALFPVVRANPTQSRYDILVSLTTSLLFSLVCAVLVFAYSKQILALFNPAYPAIAGSSLRFLGFSLLGSTLKFHACALARLGDWMRKAARWFALGAVLELCLAIAGAKFAGLQGLVVGWTLAVSIEGACAAVVFGFLDVATKMNSASGSERAAAATPCRSQT